MKSSTSPSANCRTTKSWPRRAVLWLLCALLTLHGPLTQIGLAQPPHGYRYSQRQVSPQTLPNSPFPGRQLSAATRLAPEALLQQKLRQRGNLSLNDATLREALFSISETWKINVVVGEDVRGKVDGVFKDAPLHEILHSLLFANNYGYRIVGESLVIVGLNQLGEANPMMESQAVRLRHVTPGDAVSGISILLSPQGKVQSLGESGSILIVDLPERLTKIRKFIAEIDQPLAGSTQVGEIPLEVREFSLQFMDANLALPAVQSVLSQKGKVTALAKENKLVLVDQIDKLRLVETLLATLDQPRKQVRITAYIYDVSLEDIEKLGINLNQSVQGRPDATGAARSLWDIASLMTVPAGAADPSGVMTLMNMSDNFNINAAIHALNSCANSRLLADPTVVVVDREEASIQIVTEIPFQELTQTQQGGNIGTTAFRDAGVTLNVTPNISNDNTIRLDVTPVFSALAGFTSGANPQPIINKRQADTTVRVANGQTLMLGGLRQRTENFSRKGIPYLSNLNYVGKLFRGRETDVRESELIVLITPEISEPYGSTDRPREQAAGMVSKSVLSRIPEAHDCRTPNLPTDYPVQTEYSMHQYPEQQHPMHQHPEQQHPGQQHPGQQLPGQKHPEQQLPSHYKQSPSRQLPITPRTPPTPIQPQAVPNQQTLPPPQLDEEERIPTPPIAATDSISPQFFTEPTGQYDDRFSFDRRGNLPQFVRQPAPTRATQALNRADQLARQQPQQASDPRIARSVRPLPATRPPSAPRNPATVGRNHSLSESSDQRGNRVATRALPTAPASTSAKPKQVSAPARYTGQTTPRATESQPPNSDWPFGKKPAATERTWLQKIFH